MSLADTASKPVFGELTLFSGNFRRSEATSELRPMSSQENCNSNEMAAAVRFVYPRHAMKELARVTGRPLDTARHWLYRHFNPAQRRHVATTLLAEMDRQDVERTALRRRLAQWAQEP